MTIHVLIADDHPIVRSGIRSEIAHDPDLEVVGEAVSGDEVLPKIEELCPEILLLDINMPGMKTIQILNALKDLPAPPKVLILTAFGDPGNVLGMLSAGAQGYLLKDTDPGELIKGIHALAEGRTWLCQAATQILVENTFPVKSIDDAGKALSPREEEVLGLVGMGYPNEQIAEKLGISEGTVKNHMMSIYIKVSLHTRGEVIAWAWQHGLVKS